MTSNETVNTEMIKLHYQALQRNKASKEESSQTGNPGNFLIIVQEIAQHNSELRNHLQVPLRKDVSYLGPKSQNELINIIGKKCIRQRLISELKTAKYHSISADQVTSSNRELLSVSMRYVNEERDIREVFIDFLNLEVKPPVEG